MIFFFLIYGFECLTKSKRLAVIGWNHLISHHTFTLIGQKNTKETNETGEKKEGIALEIFAQQKKSKCGSCRAEKRVKRLNPHPADRSPLERDDVGGLVRNMSDTSSVLHTLSSPRQHIPWWLGGSTTLLFGATTISSLPLDFSFSTILLGFVMLLEKKKHQSSKPHP
jgi:hypothetical protein